MTDTIPGYDYDQAPSSPVDLARLDELKSSVLFTEADAQALKTAGDVLRTQVDDVLDVWYGFVGAHPHLLAYFSTPQGDPLPDYLARVRARFGQWILDTCYRPYDEQWLAYAQEIGRRHTAPGKNRTDDAPSVPVIPLHLIVAFIYPITATMRPFLAKGGHDEAVVEQMHQAWFKSVTMQVALWLQPYSRDGVW